MILKPVLIALLALAGAEMSLAQSEPVLDGKLDYRARENTAGRDNDVFTIDLGYSRFSKAGNGMEQVFRLEGFVGHHNTDPFIGGRVHVLRQTERLQYGAALSLDTIPGEDSGADIAVTAARFWDNWAVFGHAGLQYVSDSARMDGKSIAPIASIRGVYYPLDTTSFSLGASLDGDDSLLHVGAEYQQAGASNGIFLEWVVGPSGYRGEDYYNTLRMGLRASSFKGLLKDRQRRTGDVSYVRALDSR